MQLVFNAPKAFNLTETDSTITFASDSADTLVVFGDGRKVTQKVQDAADVTVTARWQGTDLIVERKVSGGGSVTEDYLRSQDGKQLYVIVSFVTPRGRSIEFRRIYDHG